MPNDELQLVDPPRGLSAGRGVDWIGAGWRFFAKAPLMWVVSILVMIVLHIVANVVPFIGGVAMHVLQPVFIAGFVIACRSLETGGEFEIEQLFAGFKREFANLIIVGLLLLAGVVALFLVFFAFAGFGLVTAFLAGGPDNVYAAIMASGLTIALGALIATALSIPLLMAYWFAPALVVMHRMAPMAAMKASFSGCLRNILPFLIYGFLMTLLLIVAMIPIGLGLFVWLPVAIASTYVAYREIYTDEPQAAAPAMAQAA